MMAAVAQNPERQKDEVQSKLLRQRVVHYEKVGRSHDDKDCAANKDLCIESIFTDNKSTKISLSDVFQCVSCSQKFCAMDQLLSHMEDHTKEDVFQCNMCNDTFSKAESLSAHLDLHTNVVKAFKCGICNIGFLENAALMNHLKQKHEVLPFLYKCNVCLLLFKEISKLISHAAKRHPPVCKEYKCGLCEKKFSQGSRLTLHVQKHHEKDIQQPKNFSSAKLPLRKTKADLKSQDKNNDVTTHNRKTRSTAREYQQIASPEKTKNKKPLSVKNSKSRLPAAKSKQKDVLSDYLALDSESGDDNIEDVVTSKSLKRRTKSPLVNMKSQEEKKQAIKSEEELIATYKRIDPGTQKEVYDCDVCGQRFYECLSFTQHRADHFFDDKYCINCQHCQQAFDNFEDLNKHVGEGKCLGYVCPTCGKSFSLEPFLLTHQVKEHMCQKKSGGSLICRTCDKVCDNRTAFLRHASSHAEIKCIECKLCRHSFTTPEALYGHLRTTHSLIPLTRKKYSFSCKECNINFMRREALQNHKALICHNKSQESGEQPFVEPKKPKRKVIKISETQSIVKRTGHWRSAEDDKKRRTCHICNRVFRRFKDVRRHIGTHTKPYLCSHCGKAFPYRYSLDAHIKAFHSSENPFKCDVCSKYFSCPRSLIVHQRIHTGERPHQCHICHKRFRQVANLSMHVQLHNADKPIQCHLCDYRCRHRGYLKRHMSTHSKEKKHFCPICDKGFTEKPNLNHHLKRHAKIKNHVCAVCGHRFAERYYLNNHMRIHTKEKPYVCPVCNRAFTMRPNMVSHIKKTHPSYNYQPIRPSHQTIVVTGNDNNSSSPLPDTSLPIISEAININQPCLTVSGPSIPSSLQPSSIPQLPPNIPIYHTPEQSQSKVDSLSYPSRDSVMQTTVLRNQEQQPIMREPEILADPITVRSQGILREPIMGQNMLLEDPERRQYINNMSSGRMSETSGFDGHTQRDVSGQNYPVVLQGQDYMYAYSNLPSADPFIQGFFPLPNQHSQHPQQKP